MKLFQLGLSEDDIIRFAGSYICLSNRTFSAEDLRNEVIKTIDTMKSSIYYIESRYDEIYYLLITR